MKFAAWTKNRGALKEASSGGIFYELAKHFIEIRGQVCGVTMEGLTPKFIMTDNLKTVKKMRGSKYLWTSPLDVYRLITYNIEKEIELPVLFVGLPCQVSGLKQYLKNRNLNDACVTYVSLRCHGVIKSKTFYSYIHWIENTLKIMITNVKFRDKTNGWKGAGFSFTYRRNSK